MLRFIIIFWNYWQPLSPVLRILCYVFNNLFFRLCKYLHSLKNSISAVPFLELKKILEDEGYDISSFGSFSKETFVQGKKLIYNISIDPQVVKYDQDLLARSWLDPIVVEQHASRLFNLPPTQHVLYKEKLYIVHEADGEAYRMLHDPVILKELCDDVGADYEAMKKLSEEFWWNFDIRHDYTFYRETMTLGLWLRDLVDLIKRGQELWHELWGIENYPWYQKAQLDPTPFWFYYVPDVFFVCFILFLIFFCLLNIRHSGSIDWTDLIISLGVLV